MAERTNLTVKIAVAALLVAGLGAGVFFFLTGAGGTNRLGELLPDKVVMVVWASDVKTTMKLAQDAGITSDAMRGIERDWDEFRAKAGFDPLSPADLEAQGLDLTGTPAFAVAPGFASEGIGILHLPFKSGTSGVTALKGLFDKIADADIRSAVLLEESTEKDHKVLWMRLSVPEWAMEMGARATGPMVNGAAIDVSGGTLIVFALDYDFDNAPAIESELRLMVSTLVDPSAPRLAKVPGFAECMAGGSDALAGFYLNPGALGGFVAQQRELVPLVALMSNYSAVAAYAFEDQETFRISYKVITKDGVPPILAPRDTKVVDVIPGQPFVGLHASVDAEKVIRQFESALSIERWAFEEYMEGKTAIMNYAGLPPGTELYHLWNGELGFFMTDFAPSPELLIRSIVGFAGLKDPAKVKSAIDAIVQRSAGLFTVTSSTIPTGTVYRLNVDGFDVGVMIHENRLWITGDFTNFEKVIQGKGGLKESDRITRVSSILYDSNSMAAYIDLEKPMSFLPMALGRDPEFQVFAPFITKLDFVTASFEVDGLVNTANFNLHLKGDTARKMIFGMISEAIRYESSRRAEPAVWKRQPNYDVKREEVRSPEVRAEPKAEEPKAEEP